MNESQHENYSRTHSDSTSLQNQSLNNIQSSDVSSHEAITPIKYNRTAHKQLRKIMSRAHRQKHCMDKERNLKCHNMNYRILSDLYKHSAELLSRSRIYALLYIGLLIIKDEIQLGDMLRFIREGHLSYNQYQHFFSEDLANKKLNISSYAQRKENVTHAGIRELAAKIITFLKIEKYIPVQNIVGMVQRYCQEMNLPGKHFCIISPFCLQAPNTYIVNPNFICSSFQACYLWYLL